MNHSNVKKIFISVTLTLLMSLGSVVASANTASTQPMPIKPIKPIKPSVRPIYGNNIMVEQQEPEICTDVEFSGRWSKKRLCKTEAEWNQYKSDHHCKNKGKILYCK